MLSLSSGFSPFGIEELSIVDIRVLTLKFAYLVVKGLFLLGVTLVETTLHEAAAVIY